MLEKLLYLFLKQVEINNFFLEIIVNVKYEVDLKNIMSFKKKLNVLLFVNVV